MCIRDRWRLEKEAILRLVPLLLDMEARVRAGCKPVDVKTELWCGGAEGPVRVAAGSDQIQLEGRMDLVEVFEAEVAVMDVKLGGPVRALDQVRLYLRMLEETHPGKQARGAYLPLRAGGEPTLVDWTESERSGLDRKLAEAAGHIAAGRFPLLPNLESGEGESNCARCAYRRLCPTDRGVLQEIYRDWADQALGVAPEAEPEEGADA
ncbi:MAG: PD-(D/E)XK nuclease family protein, partial [Fimbriimonadales bacterium]|nr:PD-(D/E)XK nuclease family protein [Fimbriimonadales bacterium]